MSARYGLACAALTAAVALAPAATAGTPASTGVSVIYRDRVDDAGLAPDIAAVTVAQTDAGVAVRVALAKPSDLGRYDWILVGIDTDRNQRTGGCTGGRRSSS